MFSVTWLLNEFVFLSWSIWHVEWRRFVTVVVFKVTFCDHIVCIPYYAYSLLKFCYGTCLRVLIWLELLMIAKKHSSLEFGLWTYGLTRCIKSLATLKWCWWWKGIVATYPSMGVQAKSQRNVFRKGKHVGVTTNIYLRETLEKKNQNKVCELWK